MLRNGVSFLRQRMPRKRGVMTILDARVGRSVLREPTRVLGLIGAPRIVGTRSLLALDGEEHLRWRKKISPYLHGERVARHAGLIEASTDATIDAWPLGEPFPLLPSLSRLSAGVAATIVLGPDPSPRRDELLAEVRALMRTDARKLNRRPMDTMLDEEIARRRAGGGHGDDVLAMLLAEPQATDAERRDHVAMLLVASTDTTGATLCWAFEELLRDQPALERVMSGDRRYLEAVLKETLRLHPVTPYVSRSVLKDGFELDGCPVPRGTKLRVSFEGTHRRGDADEFCPERFLDGDDPEWLAFGAGVRRCVGASFAIFEMGIVVRRVLERARLRLASSSRDETVIDGISAAPARGVRVVREA